MDTETGAIRPFTAKEAVGVFAGTRWIPLDQLPDPNCKHCHGRGHTGRNLVTNKYVPCRCTILEQDGPTGVTAGG